MGKYLVLYSSPASASQTMANATTEQMKASMDEWKKWRDDASEVAKVDFGMPLEAIAKITPLGAIEVHSQITGYAIVEGQSEKEVLELLKTHPHLNRPGANIEVLKFLSMPGLDT